MSNLKRTKKSPAINEALMQEIEFMQRRGVTGFPTLLLESKGVFTNIAHYYKDANSVLYQVKKINAEKTDWPVSSTTG